MIRAILFAILFFVLFTLIGGTICAFLIPFIFPGAEPRQRVLTVFQIVHWTCGATGIAFGLWMARKKPKPQAACQTHLPQESN
jgi:hypothetical protein